MCSTRPGVAHVRLQLGLQVTAYAGFEVGVPVTGCSIEEEKTM